MHTKIESIIHRLPGRRSRLRRCFLITLLAATAGSAAAPSGEATHRWPTAAAPSGLPAAPQGGPGDLTIYPDRPAFLAAVDGQPLTFEDFADGFTGPSMISVCYQAISDIADDPCFGPGDVAPGFGIRSSRGSIFDANTQDIDLVALGASFLGTPTKVVGANVPDPPNNPTRISFDDGPTAVAMDVYDGLQGGNVAVSVYAADDAFVGSFTVTPTGTNGPAFAGFTSPRPIAYVEVNALAENGAELIGNLHFGGGPGRLTPADADFGVIATGETRTLPVEFRNDGQRPLLVGSVPPPPAPFAIAGDACSGAVLAPAATCMVQVAFAPAYASVFAHEASVPSNDPDGPAGWSLRGEAVLAKTTPAPGAVDFGSVAVGASAGAQTVTLSNLTGATATVAAIAAPPAPFQRSGGSCGAVPFQLAPGASCTLDYTFQPQSAGSHSAAVAVAGLGDAAARVRLHGRAVAAR